MSETLTRDTVSNRNGINVPSNRAMFGIREPAAPRTALARLTRRHLIGGVGAGTLGLAVGRTGSAYQGTPAAGNAARIRIDLGGEPQTLDPALTYDVDSWSVVHSIYDSLLQYDEEGQIQPLLAESMTLVDPTTLEFQLRTGISFHNGEPFDSRSVVFTVKHLLDPGTASQVAGNFQAISEVQELDDFTVRFLLSEPAPYLPAQIAFWLAMLPPDYAADPANDFAANPVGTGPYRFGAWNRGESVDLEANEDYFTASPKGQPVAQRATFRFVPEGATRVADLRSGGADLITGVPVDQVETIRSDGGTVTPVPVSGSTWVRIATDVAPFDDVRVRRALNYAVDVRAIIDALAGGFGQRLPNFFDPTSMGYDASLAPYDYDPDRARALLEEAGLEDGFETVLAVSSTDRAAIAEAIAGYLSEVGITATVEVLDLARFNETWADPEAAPLRLASWRGIFDPYTLLSLIVANEVYLSRYENDKVQALLDEAAIETDEEARAKLYRMLGELLHEEPAAIYLYDLTALYGESPDMPAWTPRPDGFTIPTHHVPE
jgi:peptide/nickel transport system substrate-binding protein